MSVIITRSVSRLEPTLRSKAYRFIEKLNEEDALPGLHIEPIQNSVDSRVRTGRVDQGYRAVLFKLTTPTSVDYVLHGIWPHDDAIEVAKKVRLTLNPVSGVTEIIGSSEPDLPQRSEPSGVAPADARQVTSLLAEYGYRLEDLTEGFGLEPRFAERVLTARDEDSLLSIAGSAPAEWQGLAVIDLAAGLSIEDINEKLGLEEPVAEADSDEAIVGGLRKPAGQLTFAWIESNDELERVINQGDFGAWRTFLHPEQRRFVDRDYKGSARVTGGAGTGKTVVILHRARALARRQPTPRVLVTTFTRNLADMLRRDLLLLDPDVPLAGSLLAPGAYIKGIDALATQIVRDAPTAAISKAAESVLGVATLEFAERTVPAAWDEAIASAGQAVPEAIRSRAFFEDEYAAVILPNEITTLTQYLRIRRPGRGMALDRAKRTAAWGVIAAYRARGRAHGSLDFAEVSALAAKHLQLEAAAGRGRLFDHVLVDEGQDLSPSHWKLLRAAVEIGANDLFISEDAHQRIYGHRVVLSHLGINVVGRARRLTLNYRTTAQNLRWAMSVLDGADYSDLAGDEEDHTGYRSARSGPPVQMVECGSQQEELDEAAAALLSWIDSDDSAETLAILVRDRYQQERVVNGLAERGVTAQRADAGAPHPGLPVVMTMHRSKGTEFGKVILFGVREGSIPAALQDLGHDPTHKAEGYLRERSLLYVAATRARDLLMVTWSGKPSPLVRTTSERDEHESL